MSLLVERFISLVCDWDIVGLGGCCKGERTSYG